MKRKYYLSILFALLGFQVWAQLADFPMSPLSEKDFASSAWQTTGEVSIHPYENQISSRNGSEAWMSSENGAVLTSKASFGEIKLRFHLLQSQSAETHLKLQNAYLINLSNSSENEKNVMGAVIEPSGFIKAARVEAAKATGLWNEIELVFKPAMDSKQARLEYLSINGIKVQTNLFLKGGKGSTQSPLSFINVKGTSVVKGIEILSFETKRPLSLENIQYSVKESQDWSRDYDKSADGVMNGTLAKLTHELPHDFKQYQTLYEADLVVAEDGFYAFTLDFAGRAMLFINNEEVVGSKQNAVRQPQIGTKELKKGTYKLQYVYQKVWWPAQLGLLFSGSTFRPYPVHSSRSLSVARLAGGIYVNPEGERPQIIRGFMMHNNQKRTEVISVGNIEGVHYSLDLETGAILHAWRGEFADVTEMWHNRGEPQLLKPLGLNLELDGGPSIYDAYMSEVSFDKYILDQGGNPTFHFEIGEAKVEKSFKPSDGELAIELKVDAPSALSIVLAAGGSIEDLKDGLYKVDRAYYVKVDANESDVQIIESDKKQLILQVKKGTKTANYKIGW